MLASVSDLVKLLTSIETVRDHSGLSDDEKLEMLTELRHEVPAGSLCRFSLKTRNIVEQRLNEAINERTKAEAQGAAEVPAKKRAKAAAKSPKAKLSTGTKKDS